MNNRKLIILALLAVFVSVAAYVIFSVYQREVSGQPSKESQLKSEAGFPKKAKLEIERLRLRIADLTNERDYLLPHLSDRISIYDNCNGFDAPVLNQHLNVPILTSDSIRVEAEILADLIGAEGGSLLHVFLDADNVEAVSDFTISHDETGFLLTRSAPLLQPTPVDLVAIVARPNAEPCRLGLRMYFFPDLQDVNTPEFRITGIMGRSRLGYGNFSLPYGTDFYKGALYVSDCSNEIIQKFSKAGQFLGGFSGFGTRLGKLDTPADIKVFNDKIYVVEERNHRVQVFDLEGKPLDLFGAYGAVSDDPLENAGKFNNPLGISVLEEQIVVVDYANYRLQSFSHDGELLWISGNSEGDVFQWDLPYYIEFDKFNDRFVVSNRTANEIAFVSRTGEKLGAIGSGVLNFPHEVAAGSDGAIYVADTYNNSVYIHYGEDVLPSRLNFPESWGIPKTIAVDDDGQLAVGFVGNGSAYIILLEPLSAPTGPERQFDDVVIVQPQAELEPPVERSGELIVAERYTRYCASCHETGRYNSPKRGSIEAWEHMSRDIEVLADLAMSGNGAMIPKGGCSECSREELKDIIRFIVPTTWDWLAE